MPEAQLDSIRRRLAAARAPHDPRARVLARADGPISAALRAALEQPARAASVLLALIERPAGLTMLFTERAAHLKDHAGQISFPGGRIAAGETAIAAALREAAEEIGLEPAQATVLGCLDAHLTVTGFLVTPVVARIPDAFRPRPDPTEVASAFEVPLAYLLAPENVQSSSRERLGTRFTMPELHYGGHRIWGATAVMLATFRDLVNDAETDR